MGAKCKSVRVALALITGVVLAAALWPSSALADGPVTPIATSYVARITSAPAGIEAKIVDGYLQVWMQVPPSETVEVLDYLGAPWVRFDRSGVYVNENSEMYYLSQTPVPETPPANLTRTTPPRWLHVSSGHAYMWRDGRLHAFAAIALAPGTTFISSWRLPIRVDGRPADISGGIWYAGTPSIVWFWPILVVLACILAAWRVRSPDLDRRLARGLAFALLVAIAVAGAGRELHGRPHVTVGQVVLLVAILAATGYGAWRLTSRRSGYLLLFVIAFASLWAGLILLPTLLHGYVLVALPGWLARTDTVVLLGGSVGLVLMALRTLDALTARGRARRERRAASVAA